MLESAGSRWRGALCVCLCLLLWMGLALPTHADLTLVEDGKSDYRIVIADEASPAARFAAERLQRDLKKSTGLTLPIVTEGDAGPIGENSRAIVLGDSAYSRSLGIDTGAIPHDGYVLRTQGSNLLIVGNDSPDEPIIDRMFGSAGTTIGVGRFLHKQLGIMQYLPGELWQHVPTHRTITVPTLDETIQPTFLNRQISLNYIVRGDPDRKRWGQRRVEFLEWARLNGAGAGELGFTAHEVDDIMRPYVVDNEYVGKPEWVALYNGERLVPESNWERSTWYRYHLCTSNPEVREIAMDYVRKFFAEKPEFQICGISMTDGDRYCQCEACVAQDVPGTDSKSDRYLNFAIDIARRAAKEFPDKKLGFFIYSAYVELPVRPENREIPDNLLLFVVKNGTYYFGEQERQTAHETMEKWSQVAKHLTYYSWPASHGFLGLPLSDPSWMIGNIEFLKEHHYQGYRHLVLGSVHARQPDTYLWGQLLYDADQDPQSLLETYYSDLYGNAASVVRSYHEMIARSIRQANEEIELEKDRGDDTVKKYEDRLLAYFEPVVAEGRGMLEEALSLVGDDTLRAKRVKVLSNQLKTAELMVEAVQIGRKLDAGEATSQELKRLEELRVAYHNHVRKHGNTDVMDVRDLNEIPRYGRDDLMRYLLIPMDYERWFDKPIDQRPAAKWQDLAFDYVPPTQAIEGKLVTTLPMEWAFTLDPEGTGEQRGLASAEPDSSWRRLRVDQYWADQGITDRVAGWYTTTVDVPASESSAGRRWLLFNAADGNARVWVDGQPVGGQDGPVSIMWNQPWALDVTDALTPGQTHRVTVRLEKHEDEGQVGLWKPVELRRSE